ncbi:MAG: hypothetical protein Q9P01_12885, partial [Anaerolineae bacterium]|nr:hypothetical protein [Anaerolineae bacterium]
MKIMLRFSVLIGVFVTVVVLVLAQGSSDNEPVYPTTPDEITEDGIMITNGLRHSVPLQDIIFDDFDIPSRSRPLSHA